MDLDLQEIKMKAYLYSVTVQDDPVHSYTRRILKEIYVPEMKYAFNSEFYIFACDKPRVPDYQEIDIDNWEASFLLNYVKVSETKNKLINKYFPGD
jgi:hypothetical protein